MRWAGLQWGTTGPPLKKAAQDDVTPIVPLSYVIGMLDQMARGRGADFLSMWGAHGHTSDVDIAMPLILM